MKLEVDLATCENHGQCTFSAPAVFSLNEQGELSLRDAATKDLVVITTPADASEEAIEEAVDMCPVQAIRMLP